MVERSARDLTRSADREGLVGRTAWTGLLLSALAVLACVGLYAVFVVRTVGFPFGLDYAEGEVWQQAKLITGSRAYGDINIYPYLGFEYPPFITSLH